MNFWRLILGTALAFSLSACGGFGKDVRDADDMKKEHDGLVGEVNADSRYLLGAYWINLNPTAKESQSETKAATHNWDQYDDTKRTDIETRLTLVLAKIHRIHEIGAHKNMKVKSSNGGIETIEMRARIFLGSLKDWHKARKELAKEKDKDKDKEKERD